LVPGSQKYPFLLSRAGVYLLFACRKPEMAGYFRGPAEQAVFFRGPGPGVMDQQRNAVRPPLVGNNPDMLTRRAVDYDVSTLPLLQVLRVPGFYFRGQAPGMFFEESHLVRYPPEVDIRLRAAVYPGIVSEVSFDIRIEHGFKVITGVLPGPPDEVRADSFPLRRVASLVIRVPVAGFGPDFPTGALDNVVQVQDPVFVLVVIDHNLFDR